MAVFEVCFQSYVYQYKTRTLFLTSLLSENVSGFWKFEKIKHKNSILTSRLIQSYQQKNYMISFTSSFKGSWCVLEKAKNLGKNLESKDFFPKYPI